MGVMENAVIPLNIITLKAGRMEGIILNAASAVYGFIKIK